MSSQPAVAQTRDDEVVLEIARDPALVRTVRLVAAAFARRNGADEDVVEEVRLAVGEACAVMIGTEGPSLPACASTSRVKAGGTDVYWAPGETRAVKAKLAGAMKVSVCEATDDDAWFGIVFAGPGIDEDMCGVGRSVANAREYQGPCRWGWIRGGTVQLGA